MGYEGFKGLEIWKKGIDIVDKIYDLTKHFPSDELYGLRSQMQRAAVSIPFNIAEGYRRKQPKDFIRFLRIALGSCAELETQLIIAARRNYLPKEDFNIIGSSIEHEVGMVMNLIKSLNNKISSK